MKYLILILSLLLFQYSHSQRIKTNGKWTKTFDASYISNAGLDYNPSFLSATNQTRINAQPQYSFYNIGLVYIHKEDIEWHPNLILEAKVTSQLHGNNSGTSFKRISNYDELFFYTYGKVKNLPIQYRISGVSVTIPVANYTTEIVYTILDWW